jgi:Polyketide cyclase / dehydrase and lipid transport.
LGRAEPTLSPSKSARRSDCRRSRKVWAIAGDFCAIKDWHPLVADCKETEEGGTTFRTLTLKNGGTIKEKLFESGIPATATRSSKARCR